MSVHWHYFFTRGGSLGCFVLCTIYENTLLLHHGNYNSSSLLRVINGNACMMHAAWCLFIRKRGACPSIPTTPPTHTPYTHTHTWWCLTSVRPCWRPESQRSASKSARESCRWRAVLPSWWALPVGDRPGWKTWKRPSKPAIRAE